MVQRATAFREQMQRRRSIRMFRDQAVPQQIIAEVIRTAGTAPSGANQQPWHFCAVSNPDMKHRIRIAAEQEEQAFYSGRAPTEWLNALAPLGTNASKPFLDIAPWLIVCFAESWHFTPDGGKGKNYYVTESVGIATGFLSFDRTVGRFSPGDLIVLGGATSMGKTALALNIAFNAAYGRRRGAGQSTPPVPVAWT
jgi:hypothetical protein